MREQANGDLADKAIVFYHMPKSAGTTLNGILKRNYAPDGLVECGPNTQQFLADLKNWPVERLMQIRMLQGHFPFGVHTLLPQGARCFTILRDPVERVFSYYYHACRDTHHYLHNRIHENNWSLKQLLESGEALMMNDGQVRLFSGVWGKPLFGEVTAEMGREAIANLRQCEVVGLTEAFDRSLLLLQHHFGWADIAYERANVGHNRPTDPPDEETVATVRRYTQQDQALYDEAQRLFTQQIRAAGLGFRLRELSYRLQQRRGNRNTPG